jgi:hypothetical protein
MENTGLHFAHFVFSYLHKIGRNMAQFQKGEGGRPKGAPNKINAEMKEWISDFLTTNSKQIQLDFMELSARDRVFIFEKFMKYILPTPKQLDSDSDFDLLTDSQLDQIINKLKRNE